MFLLFFISHYHQVLEDLYAIWDWILTEKLQIGISERIMHSAIIVIPETYDNRGNNMLVWHIKLKLWYFKHIRPANESVKRSLMYDVSTLYTVIYMLFSYFYEDPISFVHLIK